MNTQELKNIFKDVSTTQICDAINNIRIIYNSIHPITTKTKIVGKAFTVASNDNIATILDALAQATEDDVLVISSPSKEFALAGELFSAEAKRKNLAGIIIDGMCRDPEGIINIGLPFYARGCCPKKAFGETKGKINVPILCDNVEINPKDIIIADDNGIVVTTEQELTAVIEKITSIVDIENDMLDRISNGESLHNLIHLL